MEVASDDKPKRSYSWWWDSHISPKNSKWLQDNLSDMDKKIKAMIKLIEEDADSFARRAEMYYKKRPDLMKLVEEFYRAYRALAERYDHVTGALRQAHRTIAVAFLNQTQLLSPDEPPSGLPGTGDEDSYDYCMPRRSNPIQWDGEALEELAPLIREEDLKYLNWFFADEETEKRFGGSFLRKSLNLKEDEGKDFENKNLRNQINLESLRADKAEAELQRLKDSLSALKSELEAAFLQYQISQERISNLESEISKSQGKFQHLDDEIRIKVSELSIAKQRCLGLEGENTSLKLELDKLNLVVSKQDEEALDLLEENQNLHNQVNSESKRADRAEAESSKFSEAILKLKFEMEHALLQHNVSRGRISDLEAEISRTKEEFKNISDEKLMGASKLNMVEDQCLLLGEEKKSLQRELDSFMQKMTKQEEEIIMREEELYKLEQRVERQEEEILVGERELIKLKRHLEDEWKQRLCAESANKALVESHSQSQENVRHLAAEIQLGTEKLRKMELRKDCLEEEIKHLHDENNGLNEKNFSSVSKIICLQDEIISLRFDGEEKMFLQQETYSYKSKRNDLEEGLYGLMEKFRRMEQREAGLEEELRRLYDENNGLNEKTFSFSSKIVNLQDEIISLRESKCGLEDELLFHVEEKNLLKQELFSLKSERNVLEERHRELVERIEEVNFNVASLQEVVKELHNGNKELKETLNPKHEDEKTGHLEQLRLLKSMSGYNAFLDNYLSEPISHIEAVNLSMEKLAEKNEVLENSIFDLNVEFGVLRGKVKALDESCQSLYYQKSFLVAENSNLVSQVERVALNQQRLENQFAVIAGKNENVEEEDYKILNIEIENFLMKQFLVELTEKNLFLSKECGKYMDKLKHAENLFSELKQEWVPQEKKLITLSDRNVKLLEGIHVMMKAYDTRNVCESDDTKDSDLSNDGYDNIWQIISNKIAELQATVSVTKSEIHHFQLDKPFFFSLEQLEMILVELRAQHKGFEQESMLRNQENFNLQRKNHELMEINKILNVEMERMLGMLSDLQESRHISQSKISKLLEENESLSKKLYDREISEEEFYEFHELETNLSSELQTSIEECWFYKAEAMKLLQDLHVSSLMELMFKEKFFELMQMLEGFGATDIVQMKFVVEEIAIRSVQEEDLKEKVDVLGRENKGLKAELNAYAPLVASLETEIASLEERTLSLINLHILKSKRKQGNLLASLQPKNFSKVRGKHHSLTSPTASAGILELKKLRAKVKVLQKAAADTEGLLDQEVVSGANMDGETRKIKALKLNERARLVGTQKKKDIILDLIKSKEGIGTDVKDEKMTKDIELDMLSSSRHDADYNTDKLWDPTTLNIIDNYQIVKMELEISENLGLPSNYDEPLREWMDRVNGFLSTDAQRLLDLENILKELKKKTETSEMKSQQSASELDTVKLQVKEAEKALTQLIDFNYKLTKMVETFSLSSDSNKLRRKVLERVQRGAEKIDRLELKLQKVQCTLLELQEEELGSKAAKASERRYRIPLKELIYGKRSDSRKMKRQFCACMRLKTKEK